jgi:hypothetical protein
MANKQINELPSGTTVTSTDKFPIQNISGETKSITADQIADFIGTATTPGLSDVLNQDNYTNGYDIIVNAGSKIKSNTSTGEDYILPGNGFISILSNDGDVNAARIIVYPTELSINKTNTSESVDEATILFRTDGLHLLNKSTDLIYDNSIIYRNDGNINKLFNFNDGTYQSRISSDSSISSGGANEVQLYYVKNDDGELSLQIEKDTTYYSSVVAGGGEQTTFTQTATEINLASRRFSIDGQDSSIRDDGNLNVESPNQVILKSDAIRLTPFNASDIILYIEGLQVFNNNAAALSGGLFPNQVYRKNSGELMIVH